VSKAELNAIATDPDSTHVFAADNFDALKSLKALLSTKACEGMYLKFCNKRVCCIFEEKRLIFSV
jgi:hypothetical protein